MPKPIINTKQRAGNAMDHLKIIVGCLASILTLCAITGTASATEILFELPVGSSFPAGFTAKSGPTVIPAILKSAGSTLTCSEGLSVPPGGGKLEDAHLGLALMVFKKCSTTVLGIKLPCQNAKTEEIVEHFTFHLGLAALKEGEVHTVRALLFLLPGGKFSFNCTASAKIEITGEVIGELVPNKLATMGPNSSTKLILAAEGGSQKYKFFQLQLGGTLMTNIDLKTSLNGGAAELMTLEEEATLEKFTNSKNEAIEVSESLI